MIAHLKGKVLTSFSNDIVIDVGGVGYEVTITESVRSSLPSVGEETEFFVYTDVRENAIALFGFASPEERQIFLLLKKVKGVGSRLSLAILSSLGASAVLSSVALDDVAALKAVPGVGKKTAERLIVELREHVGALTSGEEPAAPSTAQATLRDSIEVLPNCSDAERDAILALMKLGFSQEKASSAVQAASSDSNQHDSGELLQRALSSL